MALIKSVKGVFPIIPKETFIAENATVVGDVVLGNDCTIWFNAVIRGDVNSIIIGNCVNIQDGVVIHASYKKYKTVIGNNVSIGHNAIVHGCTINDNVLVGMGSIVMDNCIVESNSIIASGSVVTKNTHIESGSIYAGIPAKKIKSISQDNLNQEITGIAQNYPTYASWYE